MPQWRLIGPQIPVPVPYSKLLRARGFSEGLGAIQWSRLSRKDWTELDARGHPEGRTLLLVHGTGLRTRPGFMGFSQADYLRLRERYGDRILAFEHRAFAHHLDRNGRDLARALESGGVPLELDVLGLSRGGLVTRMVVEGWTPLREDVRVHNLIFVGTPNDGTPSARRDSVGAGAREMKAWRQDVRRLALMNKKDRPVASYEDPFALPGFDADSLSCGIWPMLYGSQDQVPRSPMLQRLNGYAGAPPSPRRPVTYFGVASVFTFGHGAPNAQVLPDLSREAICEWAIPTVPNDLVVPTASVFRPHQGQDACGLFPLVRERLLVLKPTSNATHVGLFHVGAVRQRILDWVGA